MSSSTACSSTPDSTPTPSAGPRSAPTWRSRWPSRQAIVDAGLGVRSAAAALDLRFVSITWEDYDLVLPEDALDPAAPLVTAVRSSAVRSAIEALGGYDTARSGEVVDLDHTS